MNKKIKKNNDIKTPQGLIHVKHNMSLLQYKYWIILLYSVKKQILDGIKPQKHGYYYISYDEISEFIGYIPKKSEIYSDLKKLRSYPVEYNILEKDGEKAKAIDGFLYAASVSSKRVGFVLPPIFIEAMLGIDEAKNIFQLLNWEIFNSFSGKYEAILYKLCKDYVGVGRTPYMSVDEFRNYLGLKDTDYTQFFRLNEWTITKPIKAINKSIVSDIEISVIYKKQGAKTIGFNFLVEYKKQSPLPFSELKYDISFSFSKIRISPEKQKKYLDIYNSDQIGAIIDRANEYTEQIVQKGRKTNLEAIYKKAFDEGWGLENFEANKKLEEEKKIKIEEKRSEEEKEQKRKQKEKEETQKAEEKFYNLSLEERDKIRDDFFASLPTGFEKKIWLEAKEKCNGEAEKQKPLPHATFFIFYKKNY